MKTRTLRIGVLHATLATGMLLASAAAAGEGDEAAARPDDGGERIDRRGTRPNRRD